MIIKPLGVQISIASANTVANSVLVRVYNGGSAGVLNVGDYANLTLASTESVIVEKATTDTIQGTDMLAVPIGYRS